MPNRTLRTFPLALVIAALALPSHSFAAPAPAPAQDADGIIVSFEETLDRGAMKARAKEIARREGLEFDTCYVEAQFCVLQGSDAAERRTAQKATAGSLDAAVAHVEANRYIHLASDALFGQQWYLENTGQDYGVGDLTGDGKSETTRGILTSRAGEDIGWASAMSARPARGAGIVVAVIDSGVSFGGPDLPESARAPGGRNFLDGNEDVSDPHGHGTFIAGLIAAREDGTGLTGVAPRSTILPLRVADASGTATIASSAAAIRWAASQGADVINFSLASTTASAELEAAIGDAVAAGVIFVAAAGNNNGTATTYPGAYAGVVSVGATMSDGRLAPFSNTNAHVDVVAPGAHILSLLSPAAPASCKTRGIYASNGSVFGYPQTWSCHVGENLQPAQSGARFDMANGTSFSAPLVAGAAALLREQRGKGFSSTAFEGLLRTTSLHPELPAGQRDDRFGFGRMSLPRLLDAQAPAAPIQAPAAPLPDPVPVPDQPAPDAPAPVPAPENGPASGFRDVPDGHFASEPIALLRARDILQGRPDGRFQPDATMTRAEFSKVLLGVRNEQQASPRTGFDDVPASHSLAGYVHRLVELEWARGQGALFHPDHQVSRMEAARMIQRAAQLQLSGEGPFSDIANAEERSIAGAMATAQIFSGQDGMFMPDRPITRAEAAKVLAKVLQ